MGGSGSRDSKRFSETSESTSLVDREMAMRYSAVASDTEPNQNSSYQSDSNHDNSIREYHFQKVMMEQNEVR